VHNPPERSLAALREHGVPQDVVDAACAMTTCIMDAADDVASDTREEAFDDATSRGGLLYRRAHNRVLAVFDGVQTITLDRTDNALHVRVGEIAVSFYSARDGLDFPNLDGSITKRNVVDEMQMVLEVGQPALRRLVLMHESDEDGAVRVALGVMASPRAWAWRVTMFDRFATEEPAAEGPAPTAYDDMAEPELPPMEPREQDEAEDAEDQ